MSDTGRTFSGLIQSFVAACGPLNKEFLPLYETDAGKKVYQETLDAVQHNFPQYIKELQGTADGSKVPFHKLFLLHMDDILPNVLAQRSSNNTNGCSTVCCNYPGQLSSLSPTLTFLAHQSWSQMARPCSKLADQSYSPHTPSQLARPCSKPAAKSPDPHTHSQLARPCYKLADQYYNPHTPSQLARSCSKLADQSRNPHNPTKLRGNWLGYSAPGVHHFVELLGHTEDALAETLNHIYFVSAHIISDKPQGRWNVTEERFMSLCYAGHLPGFTMSYNHHGLVFSVNIIMAKTLAAGKTLAAV
uniref:Peptidase C45 hydrolase domain-containing protein n=1 Tax=Timema monikensis TaxID=170555 RepID=A0A7R9EJK9_9NEOP|nr:unnamed protein product [Timema monikensis]